MENTSLKHIAFIMDGNRRWARSRGLPTLEGHRRGYNKLKEVADWCFARGISEMTAFAFSTENWNRSKEEVDYLMNLLHFALTKELGEFTKRGIKLRIIGRREGLPENVAGAIPEAEAATAENKKGTLYIAINYGGRAEIVDAAKKAISSGMEMETMTEESLRKFLYAPEASDPDLIIRTSGEQRTSGFLTYQGAYSELYFAQKHWPEFEQSDLDEALAWYQNRERRFGK
ncbi:di-trans,poly-cis-decaprenylcistransferase [Candidatus Uhrbacteria bacterium]|nr:di-trans,poly-cis-decaprenylcistransferase [Candidatus Uhrbacteria bacterium]